MMLSFRQVALVASLALTGAVGVAAPAAAQTSRTTTADATATAGSVPPIPASTPTSTHFLYDCQFPPGTYVFGVVGYPFAHLTVTVTP